MKMKMIVPMLVICLILSLGSALAQTEPGIMEKTRAGSMDKMAGGMYQATVIMAGKMNGTVTMDNMTGMAGGMSSSGKTMTRNVTGDLVVIKDISNKTENIIMIGKMDGMTKRMVMIGKTEYESVMPGNNEGMNGMAGNMDNMAGAKDKEKVVVTGNIKCMTVGKMVVIGQESDFKEMAGDNAGMTGVSDDKQIMSGMNGNMDKTAGAMDNKNLIATANIRCNMTGKMIIIGKLSDIKKMAGYGKEGMKGAATYKAGAAGYSNEDIKGVAAYKAGAAGYSNEDVKGAAAYKAGTAGYSNEDMTIIMTGITKCKITFINMVVIGKMDKMTGMAEKINKKPGMAEKNG